MNQRFDTAINLYLVIFVGPYLKTPVNEKYCFRRYRF